MKAPDRNRLTNALRDHVAKIAADLRTKMRAPGGSRVAAEQLHKDERIGENFEVWTDLLSRRAAVLWVLKSVYVRVLEDRGLLMPGRLLDPEAQQLFEKLAPNLGETAFLRWMYKDLASPHGGVPELFSLQPAEVALPSDELSRALLAFWRHRDADTGAVWSFAEEKFEGELMGDLYQELDPVVKERFALCQTPDFVRAFILDRTLTPAIETFGANEVRLLDPACGSGHFLIDGLKRLVAATTEKHPDWDRAKVVAHALDRVVGVDLNDYACALARTRLIMTAAELAGVTKLADAASFHPHVYWADGLEQVEREEQKPPLQFSLFEKVEERPRATLTRSDVRAALKKVFEKKFHVVAANPPYILENDETRKHYQREKIERRQRYVSAYMQYHLSSPFTERCFQLSVKDGFVGLIVDNQFMKRDYGRPLVEEVLPGVDLQMVVDTSRAQIPNHGTPTVILFSRNRPAVASEVHTVLSKRAEAGTLSDPQNGAMWLGILAAASDAIYEDEFVLSRMVERDVLGRHPWSIGDDTSASIIDTLEALPHTKLGKAAQDIGRTTACGHDPVFILPWHAVRTLRAEGVSLPFVEGSAVRDWSVTPRAAAVYPYVDLGGAPLGPRDPRVPSYLWKYRALLSGRTMFGKTIAEHGKVWFEHLEHYGDRIRQKTKIAFSNIATHNHFALTISSGLFNSKAPVITLRRDYDAIAPAIVALLSSSLACYWMKDRFQPRGATSANRNHPDPERAAYEFSVTGMKQFPLLEKAMSSGPLFELGAELARLSAERQKTLRPAYWSGEPFASASELRERLAERWREHDRIRQQQVFVQEEIDWLVYSLCAFSDPTLLAPPNGPRQLPRGQRAFERLTGHRSFVRHRGALLPTEAAECETGSKNIPNDYVGVTAARERAIAASPALTRIESYMYKRLWRDTEENIPESQFRRQTDANQLLEAIRCKIEAAAAVREHAFSVGRLAADLMEDASLFVLAEVTEETAAFDLEIVIREAIAPVAVPNHPAHIYSDSGRSKRLVWEEVWENQRIADAGGPSAHEPVPPAYSQGSRGQSRDFLRDEFWKLRGAYSASQSNRSDRATRWLTVGA